MDAYKFVSRPFRKKKGGGNDSGSSSPLPSPRGSGGMVSTSKQKVKSLPRTVSDQLTQELLHDKHETYIDQRPGYFVEEDFRTSDNEGSNSRLDYTTGKSKKQDDDKVSKEKRTSGLHKSHTRVRKSVEIPQEVSQKSGSQNNLQGEAKGKEGPALENAALTHKFENATVGDGDLLSASLRSNTSLGLSSSSMAATDGSSIDSRSSSMARSLSGVSNGSSAKDRWKKLKNSVVFANQISANYRMANMDVVDEAAATAANFGPNESHSTKAPNKEGLKTWSIDGFKPRGRAGIEGLQVKADKNLACRCTDFYITWLKMPAPQFVACVFASPLLLAVIFTPLFLLDTAGLEFSESVVKECPADAKLWELTRHGCSVLLNIFLYALSLSTTFGGSPVDAVSPFSLIVANLNTLMAQFLFVFLSGAVFARMSQPGQPIRCSKKAIIRKDDIVPLGHKPGESAEEEEKKKKKYKVFAMRLVLIGPPPCELVDVKVSVTFRIYMKVPTGAIFCSTTDLKLVRQDVAYLKYGLMCRHVIDEDSPVFGHTPESLLAGDASFSVTIVAMERTSMQSIFHKQEYFAYDDEVVWDGEYHDFIYVNENGMRVLDHSKLDKLNHFKVGGLVSTAITRMHNEMSRHKADKEHGKDEDDGIQKGGWGSLKSAVIEESISKEKEEKAKDVAGQKQVKVE